MISVGMLLTINILLSIIVLFVMIFGLNYILEFLNKRGNSSRSFIQKNEGFFSILFIILFAAEQGILIILIFIFGDNLDFLKLMISIFSLIVITTASLEKFLLETKRRYEKEQQNVAVRMYKFIERLLKDRK